MTPSRSILLAVLLLLAASGNRASAQIALWPGQAPDEIAVPGPETETRGDGLIAGRPITEVTNVTRPTMSVFSPAGESSGAAVLVIPGGGFELLAIDLEGTEVCDWLTAKGVTCVLLKYRVPSLTYDWRCRCRPDNLALPTQGLEDAQRAMRVLRHRAADWRIDPRRIGVLGFSAGGYLVASISTNYGRRLYAPIDEADRESARPDFAIALYPGHLLTRKGGLNPNVPVSRETPPTFLAQAEDDPVDSVEQSLTYYAALRKQGVPVEMHLFAKGGHAFGLRRTADPITGWPDLAETWLRTIGMMR